MINIKQLKVISFFIIMWLLFVLLKLNISINLFDTNVLGFALTVTTLLFSFLVGYYLNSRYDRYIMIRDSHIDRHSKCLNLIQFCKSLSKNRILLKELYSRINDIAIINELASWSEGYMEEPYYKRLYDLVKLIDIKTKKDKEIFKVFLIDLDHIDDLTRRLTALGRDKLGIMHGVLLLSLALIIVILTFSIPFVNLFGLIVLMIFPPMVMLSVYIIYGYQYMIFLKESTSMEINQKLFDEIGKKRFYKKSKLQFVREDIRRNKDLYRVEDDLKGSDRDIYLDYLDKEFYVDRIKKKKVYY